MNIINEYFKNSSTSTNSTSLDALHTLLAFSAWKKLGSNVSFSFEEFLRDPSISNLEAWRYNNQTYCFEMVFEYSTPKLDASVFQNAVLITKMTSLNSLDRHWYNSIMDAYDYFSRNTHSLSLPAPVFQTMLAISGMDNNKSLTLPYFTDFRQWPAFDDVFCYNPDVNTEMLFSFFYILNSPAGVDISSVPYASFELGNDDGALGRDALFGPQNGFSSGDWYSDITVSIPPFGKSFLIPNFDLFGLFNEYKPGQRVNNGDTLLWRSFLATSDTVVVCSPQGALSRQGKDREYRKHLIDSNLVKAVIQLPSRIFAGTGISTSILIFDKNNKTDTICFIDASALMSDKKRVADFDPTRIQSMLVSNTDIDGLCRFVDASAVASQDFDFTAARYLVPDAPDSDTLLSCEMVPLSTYASIIKPQVIEANECDVSVPYRELRISDFSEAGFTYPEFVENAKMIAVVADHLKRDEYSLKPFDVVISARGSIGKAAIISDQNIGDTIASQTTYIIRPKDGNENISKFLYLYLKSPAGQAALLRIKVGATVPAIKSKDVENLSVPKIGSIDKVIEQFDKLSAIVSARKELEREQSDLLADFSALLQTVP